MLGSSSHSSLNRTRLTNLLRFTPRASLSLESPNTERAGKKLDAIVPRNLLAESLSPRERSPIDISISRVHVSRLSRM